MAITFDSIPFAVLTETGNLPAVEAEEDGANVWSGEIRIDGNTNWELMRAKMVKGVQVRLALGSNIGGAIIIPGEGSFADLVIPANNGDEQTWRAVLRLLQPMSIMMANIWRAKAEWVCGDRVS